MSIEFKKKCLEEDLDALVAGRDRFVHPNDYWAISTFDPLVKSDSRIRELGETHAVLKYCTRVLCANLFVEMFNPKICLVSPSFAQISQAWDFLAGAGLDPKKDLFVLFQYDAYDFKKRLVPHDCACREFVMQMLDLVDSKVTTGEFFYDIHETESYRERFNSAGHKQLYVVSVHVMYFVSLIMVKQWYEWNPQIVMLSILNLPFEILATPNERLAYYNARHHYAIEVSNDSVLFQGLEQVGELGEKTYPHNRESVQNWRRYFLSVDPELGFAHSVQKSCGVTKLIMTTTTTETMKVSNLMLKHATYNLAEFGEVIVPMLDVTRIRSLLRSLKSKDSKDTKENLYITLRSIAAREAALQLFSFDTVGFVDGVPDQILPHIIAFEIEHLDDGGFWKWLRKFFIKESMRGTGFVSIRTNEGDFNSVFAKLIILAVTVILHKEFRAFQSDKTDLRKNWYISKPKSMYGKFLNYISGSSRIKHSALRDCGIDSELLDGAYEERFKSCFTLPESFKRDFTLEYRTFSSFDALRLDKYLDCGFCEKTVCFRTWCSSLKNNFPLGSVFILKQKIAEHSVEVGFITSVVSGEAKTITTLITIEIGDVIKVRIQTTARVIPPKTEEKKEKTELLVVTKNDKKKKGNPFEKEKRIDLDEDDDELELPESTTEKIGLFTAFKASAKDLSARIKNDVLDFKLPNMEYVLQEKAKEINPLPVNPNLKNLYVAGVALKMFKPEVHKLILYFGCAKHKALIELIMDFAAENKIGYLFVELESEVEAVKKLFPDCNIITNKEYALKDINMAETLVISDAWSLNSDMSVTPVDLNATRAKVIYGLWKTNLRENLRRPVLLPPFGKTYGGIAFEMYAVYSPEHRDRDVNIDNISKFYPKLCTKFPTPAESGEKFLCCTSCLRFKSLFPSFQMPPIDHTTPETLYESGGYNFSGYCGPFGGDFANTGKSRLVFFQGAPGCGKTTRVISHIINSNVTNEIPTTYLCPVARITRKMADQFNQTTTTVTTAQNYLKKITNETEINGVLIIDEVYALGTEDLHKLCDLPFDAVYMFGDRRQIHTVFDEGKIVSNAVKPEHVPRGAARFYSVLTYRVPTELLRAINSRITDSDYHNTMLTKKGCLGQYKASSTGEGVGTAIRRRAKEQHDGKSEYLIASFSNMGEKFYPSLPQRDGAVYGSVHSLQGCVSTNVTYVATDRDIAVNVGHFYSAITRSSVSFEVIVCGGSDKHSLLAQYFSGYLYNCVIAPIGETLLDVYLNTYLGQMLIEDEAAFTFESHMSKLLSFTLYAYLPVHVGAALHLLHNHLTYLALIFFERDSKKYKWFQRLLLGLYVIILCQQILCNGPLTAIVFAIMKFLKDTVPLEYRGLIMLVATIDEEPVKMFIKLVMCFMYFLDDFRKLDFEMPAFEDSDFNGMNVLININSEIEDLPKDLLLLLKDKKSFAKGFRKFLQGKEGIIRTKVPNIPNNFDRRETTILDTRVNRTDPVKLPFHDHVQVQSGFINKNHEYHANTGNFEYPDIDVLIVNREQGNILHSSVGRENFEITNVTPPQRNLRENDLELLKNLVSIYHEIPQFSPFYDEPIKIGSVVNRTTNVSMNVPSVLVERVDIKSWSDATFGVHQTTSIGWQSITLLARFSQDCYLNLEDFKKKIIRRFGEEEPLLAPEQKALEAFSVLYQDSGCRNDLSDIALLNQFNVFIKQAGKVGGTYRMTPLEYPFQVHPTIQSFISKKQHKLEAPSTTSHNRSAGSKVKGGQPVNSTDSVVSLYLGTVVRVMTYFLRNFTSERFFFQCGDEQSPLVAEETYRRYHVRGRKYLASDVTSMDTIHSPLTYTFFSKLFSLFCERVFGFSFDFMGIFMDLTTTWKTRSMTEVLKAYSHFFLSSGLPWTLMLNTVTCFYLSGLMKNYGDIIFGLYTGDDSLEQLVDECKIDVNCVERYGIKVKPIYTYGHAEFTHKIFFEGLNREDSGSFQIVTRNAAKFLSKRFNNPIKLGEDVKEFMQGFRENLRRDLSLQRYARTLSANIEYHGPGSKESIVEIMRLLNIIICTDANRLRKFLLNTQVIKLKSTQNFEEKNENICNWSDMNVLFRKNPITTKSNKKETLLSFEKEKISMFRSNTKNAQPLESHKILPGVVEPPKKAKRERIYCVPALFNAMGFQIPNEVYDAIKLQRVADDISKVIVLSDGYNQHAFVGRDSDTQAIPFRLLINEDHTHAVSLGCMEDQVDGQLNVSDLAIAGPPKNKKNHNQTKTVVKERVVVPQGKGKNSKKIVAVTEEQITERGAPKREYAPFIRKVKARGGEDAYTGVVSMPRQNTRRAKEYIKGAQSKKENPKLYNAIKTVIDPLSVAKPYFVPFDTNSQFVSDHKSVTRENLSLLNYASSALYKLVMSDSIYAQYFESANAFDAAAEMVMLNLGLNANADALVPADTRFTAREGFRDQPIMATIQNSQSAEMNIRTGVAFFGIATDQIAFPQMLDIDNLATFFGTGDLTFTEGTFASYVPGETLSVNFDSSLSGSSTIQVNLNCVTYDPTTGAVNEGVNVTLGSVVVPVSGTSLVTGTLSTTAPAVVIGYSNLRLFNSGGTINFKKVIMRHAVGIGATAGVFPGYSRLRGKAIQSATALSSLVERYRPLASSLLLTSTAPELTVNGNLRMNQITSGNCPSDSNVSRKIFFSDLSTAQNKFKTGLYSAPNKYAGPGVTFNQLDVMFPFWQPYTVVYVEGKNNAAGTPAALTMVLTAVTIFQLKLVTGQQIKNVYPVPYDAGFVTAFNQFMQDKKFMTENPNHLSMIANLLRAVAPVGTAAMRGSGNKYLSFGADFLDGAMKLF